MDLSTSARRRVRRPVVSCAELSRLLSLSLSPSFSLSPHLSLRRPYAPRSGPMFDVSAILESKCTSARWESEDGRVRRGKETGQTQDAVKRGHLHNDEAEFVDAVIYSEASLCIYFGIHRESTESDFHPMIAPGALLPLCI